MSEVTATLQDHAEMGDQSEIISLNVGGQRFSTTRHTLQSISDTFFTVLLSGRIPSYKDSTGAIFIDRDPELFSIILNYLRTHQLFNIREDNVDALKHEAQFYGISPMMKQLALYENMVSNPTCGGDILFQVFNEISIITIVIQWYLFYSLVIVEYESTKRTKSCESNRFI